MCDDHEHGPAAATPGPFAGVSRRGVFRGAGLAAAAGAVPVATWSGQANAARARPRPITMGMHVHASFSEGPASVASQLQCARDGGVDVVWFTEHDWRMGQHSYRTEVSFDSLTREEEFGRAWLWQPLAEGSPATVAGGIVTSPTSPGDPSATPGALRALVAASSSDAGDGYFWYANTGHSRQNSSGNLAGTTVSVDVCAVQAGADGWGELRILLSNHPATSSRPAGQYLLSYRFGAAGPRVAQGFTGIVPVAVPTGRWTTVTLDPVSDITRLWPDLVAEDNSLADLWLGAVARSGATAEVVFDYLRFQRAQPATLSPFGVQAGLLSAYASSYPEVTAIAAQEVSFLPEHLNWFAGDDYLVDYTQDELGSPDDPAATDRMSRALLARGGMISINHPFGAEGVNTTEPSQSIGDLSAQYLRYAAYGATMLEVGYQQRGGATLDQHLQLWDVLSRNGVYLTGTGVNDNHVALDPTGTRLTWEEDLNRFTTTVTSASTAEAALLAPLAAGNAFCSELTQPGLTIGVSAKNVPMGSVSVQPGLKSRPVFVDAARLPAGGSVAVVQGQVDYAGSTESSNAEVVDVIPASRFGSGRVKTTVGTRTSSYVRTVVSDGDGREVAFSNPIWLLREPSQQPVPAARRAKG